MKIKAIAQLVSKRKTAVLYTADGSQWISDGVAIYALPGFPQMGLGHIFRMFDISEDKAADFFQEEKKKLPMGISGEDYEPGERALELQGFSFQRKGYEFCVLTSDDGAGYLLQSKYLTPFEDVDKIEFALRETGSGQVYITANDGMFTVAILCPYDDGGGEFSAYLRGLAQRLDKARGSGDKKTETGF